MVDNFCFMPFTYMKKAAQKFLKMAIVSHE